jgi:ATP-binding cassette, subfamily C, bacteriocin exporter
MFGVKWIQAHESRDCGAACLATVALHYGVRLDVGKIAILAGTTMQGARLDRLRDTAHALGFAASCGKLKSDKLRSAPLPAILHLTKSEGEHYVVLLRWKGDNAVIADPTIGVQEYSTHDLLREFSGFALLLKPDDHFRKASEKYKGRSPLSITISVVRQSRGAFVLASVAALLAACTALAVPFFVGRLVDGAIIASNQDSNSARFAVELFLLIAVAGAAFTIVKYGCIAALSVEIEQGYLSRFIDRLSSLPLNFFDRCHPGDVIARINDAVLLRSAIAGPILTLVLDVGYLVAASFLLVRMSLTLLLIAVASTLTAYVTHAIIRPHQVVHTRISRTRMTELMSKVLEATTGIRLVKTFCQEASIARKIETKHFEALTALRKMNALAGWSTASGLLINGSGMVILILVAQQLIAAHRFTPGQLTYLVAISSVMMASAQTIASALSSIEDVALSTERLTQTERAEPERILPPQSTARSIGAKSLQFASVSFSYGDEATVIEDVTFSVGQGEVVGIRGASGAGKSTLALLCNGLYQITSGEIHVLGREVREWNLPSLRRSVSIVFSDSNLVSGTIRDNLILGGLDRNDDEIAGAARMACAQEFIEALPNGYSYRLGYMGLGLSSGQRQRIALARAFLTKPEILILDEATSNLDIAMEREVLGRLLGTRTGLTTILISHRPETLANADRVLDMVGGRLLGFAEQPIRT